MRTIEFRAFHKPTRRMFDVFSWCKDYVFENSDDGVGTSPTLPAEMKDCELMQFTGLYDKKGKKIFERDVLQNPEKTKGVVEFFDGSFCLKYKNGYYVLNSGFVKNKEVVENIDENPELL